MSGVEITWTGVDGSTWDLIEGTKGVRLSQGSSGLVGLSLPTFSQHVSKSARRAGQRYLGTTWDARTVVFTVFVGDTGVGPFRTGELWRELDAAWWRSVSPEQPGLLTVTTESGSRTLACRLADSGTPGFVADPALYGKARYTITLEADWPFWAGPDVVETFVDNTAPVSYYGPTGLGPPFTISPANRLSTASIGNPGDRPVFSRWLFSGPGTWTFSLAGHSTVLPDLADGQVVSIDTDPTVSSAVQDVTDPEHPTDFWPFMGAHDFWVPVAAQQTSFPLGVDLSGGKPGRSQVQVALTPAYQRAW